MFIPSAMFSELMEEALPAAFDPLSPSRPDVTARNVPLLGEPISKSRVQEAVGEKIMRLLGTIARHCVTASSTAAPVLIMLDRDSFTTEVRDGLLKRLDLPHVSQKSQKLLLLLARDFYDHYQRDKKEREEFGIVFGSDFKVYIRCPDLKPVLRAITE